MLSDNRSEACGERIQKSEAARQFLACCRTSSESAGSRGDATAL